MSAARAARTEPTGASGGARPEQKLAALTPLAGRRALKVQPARNRRELPEQPEAETHQEPRTEKERQPHEQNPETVTARLDEGNDGEPQGRTPREPDATTDGGPGSRWDMEKGQKMPITVNETETQPTSRELETALRLEPISFCSHHSFCESKKK